MFELFFMRFNRNSRKTNNNGDIKRHFLVVALKVRTAIKTLFKRHTIIMKLQQFAVPGTSVQVRLAAIIREELTWFCVSTLLLIIFH